MKIRLILFFIVSLTISCNNSISDMDRTEISKIEYDFSDSSTPPRYHRSYQITVLPKKVKVVVDSYGTKLANETYPIQSSDFEKLVALTKNLDGPGTKITKGATGTKGYNISLYKGDKEFYNQYWDSLSKVGQGSEDFIAAVKALVPNLSELTGRPLPEPDGE